MNGQTGWWSAERKFVYLLNFLPALITLWKRSQTLAVITTHSVLCSNKLTVPTAPCLCFSFGSLCSIWGDIATLVCFYAILTLVYSDELLTCRYYERWHDLLWRAVNYKYGRCMQYYWYCLLKLWDCHSYKKRTLSGCQQNCQPTRMLDEDE